MKIILAMACLATLILAETSQQKSDAQWLREYHRLTANLRKAQQEREDHLKVKIADCQTRGMVLQIDQFQEPVCTLALPPAPTQSKQDAKPDTKQ
jgi:hypothetical protein